MVHLGIRPELSPVVAARSSSRQPVLRRNVMNHSASPSLSSRVTRPAYQGTCRNGEAVLSGPSLVLVEYLFSLRIVTNPSYQGTCQELGKQ